MNKLADTVLGTCARCGGFVTVPRTWYGTRRPEPRCVKCGGVATTDLPVIRTELFPPQPKPEEPR